MAIVSIVLSLLLLAGCGPLLGDRTGTEAPGLPPEQETFVFWDKGEYIQVYNELMRKRLEQFGRENGVDVEYVLVGQNEFKEKLFAALEAGSPPDLIVTNDYIAKQFISTGQLIDTSDMINKIDFLDSAKQFVVTSDQYYLVPQAFLIYGAYLRQDVWDKHRLPPPATWQELYEQAKIVNDPQNGFYATGFSLGASGGGDSENMIREAILAFGGSIVDPNNNIVVNSKETLEALTFLARFWEEGLTPPSSVTWDDLGNNRAYLKGQVGFVLNSGSIYEQAKKEAPAMEKNTQLIPKLAGPKGTFILGQGNVFALFKNENGTKWAKKFVTEFYDQQAYTEFIEAIGGKFQPVLRNADDTPFWNDPANKAAGWNEMLKDVVGSSNYPGPEDDLSSKARSEQVGTRALYRIVVQKMDPQQSLDLLELELKQLYGRE